MRTVYKAKHTGSKYKRKAAWRCAATIKAEGPQATGLELLWRCASALVYRNVAENPRQSVVKLSELALGQGLICRDSSSSMLRLLRLLRSATP